MKKIHKNIFCGILNALILNLEEDITVPINDSLVQSMQHAGVEETTSSKREDIPRGIDVPSVSSPSSS